MGFELMTSSLPRMRSTPELHRLLFGAEDEVRTRDPQLGRLMLYQLSYFRKNLRFLRYCRLRLGIESELSLRSACATIPPCFALWGEVDSNHRTRRSGFTVRRNCRYAIPPSFSETVLLG